MEIFIGCGTRSIEKYCSENGYRPFDIYSLDNGLCLVFNSDIPGGGKGFVTSHSAFSTDSSHLSSSCYGESGSTLTSTSGVIDSRRRPGNYPSSRDFSWEIEVGSRRSIKIAFMDVWGNWFSWMDFDLHCDIGCDDDTAKAKGGSDYQ